jgi:hypothetical protein
MVYLIFILKVFKMCDRNEHMFITSLKGIMKVFPLSPVLQTLDIDKMREVAVKAGLEPGLVIFPGAPSKDLAQKFDFIFTMLSDPTKLKQVFGYTVSGISVTSPISKIDIDTFANFFILDPLSGPTFFETLRNKALKIDQAGWEAWLNKLREVKYGPKKEKIYGPIQNLYDRLMNSHEEDVCAANPDNESDFDGWSDEHEPEPKESFRKPAVKTAEDRLVYRDHIKDDRCGSSARRNQLRQDTKRVASVIR